MRTPNQSVGIKRTERFTWFSNNSKLLYPQQAVRVAYPAPPPPPFVPGFRARPGILAINCGSSCTCEGGPDCFALAFSGCCGGDVSCTANACSCVNTGGCDKDGNLP
jgi:hypothetical protein